MNYFPIPIAMLEIGKPLPVDVWTPTGTLLLRKGHPVESEAHREKLYAHHASSTLSDALAWQRSYERMVHAMLRDGADLHDIARARMPSEIRAVDYSDAQKVDGGWLDLQEVLRGILYQGGLAINPLARLAGIEEKALALLAADPDDSLFCLLQALADDSLGYCATHALLCVVLCKLTAHKLGLSAPHTQALVSAALTMNIGMARAQDSLARQSTAPTDMQRSLIKDHPLKGAEILRSFGVEDADHLDLVSWHHAGRGAEGEDHLVALREVLSLADGFVARMAARKTRAPLAPVKAVRTMVLGAQGDAIAVGSAMAQAVGFYPPGSYVLLANGETAVAVQRGERANAPWVISIADKNSMPITVYQCKDTGNPTYAIAAPLDFQKVRVAVSVEKVRKARAKIPGTHTG